MIARREFDLGYVETDTIGSEFTAIPCWQGELVIIALPGSSEWLRFTCDQPMAGKCKMPGCNATGSRRHGARGYVPAFIAVALVTPLLPSAQAESSRAADIFE